MRQQRLRRVEIATQGWLARAKDAGLLEGHRLAVVAQPFGVVDADTGHQGQIGVDQVDRVQAPTQPDLQHHGVQGCALEQPESRQGAHLEIGQGNLATRGLDRRESLAKLGIAGLDTGNLHTLVVAQQVGRAVHPDLEVLLLQQSGKKSTGRALAIGAGNGDHPRRRPGQAQALCHGP
ncbi:hypothetical protein D3C71_1603550 [compost metagenome]